MRSQAGTKVDRLRAKLLFKQLIAVGELTGAKMNLKKCCPPARVMEILGFTYDSIKKLCRLSEEKKKKYIQRINVAIHSPDVTVKDLEKIVGNLTYSAWVAPFGRPFLSVLSGKISPSARGNSIKMTNAMYNALVVWRMILTKNKGLSFDFIFGKLPRAKNE